MHIFYVDESYDHERFVLTAICIREEHWRPAFTQLKLFRQQLKRSYGIKVTKELHAASFIRDCSDGISDRKLSLRDRREVFELVLVHAATLPILLFNICLPIRQWGSSSRAHEIAIERLANRLQATMRAEQSHAIAIFDTGKERQIVRLIRKMSVFNYIPSQFGTWRDGASQRNIVLDRLVEDVFFKRSEASYFLQIADFAAFTLLKRESQPPARFIRKWGYDTLFPRLNAIRFLRAGARDPDGIVR